MTDAEIKASGFTDVKDGLPTEDPHRHGYLLIEEYAGRLVYALAE